MPRSNSLAARGMAAAVLVITLLLAQAQTIDAAGPSGTHGPTISGVAASTVSKNAATITWSLNVPATGQVEYGKTKAYGRLSTPELSYKYRTHVQTLSGLSPGTLYHFRVMSKNAAGGRTVSQDHTFTTLGARHKHTPKPGRKRHHHGIPVPGSIDASGGSDVSGALQRFVDGVPNGSTIVFKAGGTYRVSHGLRLAGRHDLVFAGNGATIQTTGAGDDILASPFVVDQGSQHITIRDLSLVGNDPDAGTAYTFHRGLENQMGVAIYGAFDVEIANVSMKRFYSDCVYIGANGSNQAWSERIWIHDSSCTLNGRQGVAIVAARDVTIERDRFDQLGGSPVDIEPDAGWQGATNVTISANTIGSYGLTNDGTCWLLGAVGASGSTVEPCLAHRQHHHRQPPCRLRRPTPRAQRHQRRLPRAAHRLRRPRQQVQYHDDRTGDDLHRCGRRDRDRQSPAALLG